MKYKTLKELFTGICDAVRVKKGIAEEIAHQDLPDEILDISSVDVSGVTATVEDVVAPKVFVDSDGVEQTGAIPTKSSSNLTADGATVSVPAGYYPTEVSKSVETATQATPSIEVNSSGLITAKTTQSAGYVAAGTKSGTKQLTTQAAKTVTPTKSEQTAVAAGVYTTGAVKVAKIPDSYVQPSGTKSITENGTHDVTSFAAVNVNVPSEDLTAVLDAQEQLISELEAELEGKAAGGGGAVYNATFTSVAPGVSYFDQDGIAQTLETPGTIQPLNGVIKNNNLNIALKISGDYLAFPEAGVQVFIIKSDVSVTAVGGGSND